MLSAKSTESKTTRQARIPRCHVCRPVCSRNAQQSRRRIHGRANDRSRPVPCVSFRSVLRRVDCRSVMYDWVCRFTSRRVFCWSGGCRVLYPSLCGWFDCFPVPFAVFFWICATCLLRVCAIRMFCLPCSQPF
jgi:hypothetical protein